jgi:CheY-like chemotaxis protein
MDSKANIKNILLVEDDSKDVELTLAALEENHLVNRIVVLENGVEALDYLYEHSSSSVRPV